MHHRRALEADRRASDAATYVLVVGCKLGFLYLIVELIGLFLLIEFGDTWPMVMGIFWSAVLHGTFPERVCLAVLSGVALYGLTRLFERR